MNPQEYALPQLGEQLFLTDGGIETTMIYHNGFDLPEFATFVLLNNEQGRLALLNYYRRYLDIARDNGCGFVLEAPTWRANRDWANRLGIGDQALRETNIDAIRLLQSLRNEYAGDRLPIVVSGNVGPRGDGYVVGETMNAIAASAYHGQQIAAFKAAGADMVTAMTMTYVDEALGIVNAASASGLPVVVGFTTETDGRLPSGMPLADAIAAVDEATAKAPAYYMINCAHPDHFAAALDAGEAWAKRVRSLRANASRMSHAELDVAETLDDGDPEEFGELHRRLHKQHPQLTVLGGCCGTDHRHVAAVSKALGA